MLTIKEVKVGEHISVSHERGEGIWNRLGVIEEIAEDGKSLKIRYYDHPVALYTITEANSFKHPQSKRLPNILIHDKGSKNKF